MSKTMATAMNIKPIRTKADYRAALKEAERLWNANPGTADGDRVDVLVTLIQAYEAKHFPIEAPGNVFTDIGFSPGEAETLAAKADLVSLVAHAIRSRRLTQKEAAKICGTEQATLSKVLNGKLTSVTIDRLAKWLFALGWSVKISAEPKTPGKKKIKAQTHAAA